MIEQLTFFRTERDRLLDALQHNHKAYVVTLRSFARVHAMQHGTVTIDDVRDVIEREQFFMPSDVGIDTRVFGVVFRSKDFEPTGQRISSRPERIARSGVGASYVTVYRLATKASAA